MRKISLIGIICVFFQLVPTQTAFADSPFIEWRPTGVGFDSYSQIIQISKLNESIPLFIQLSTKSSQPVLSREEAVFVGINFISSSEFRVQFSLDTTSLKSRTLSGTDCNIMGAENDFHSVMCFTNIKEDLIGTWKIAVLPADQTDSSGTWFKASITNLKTGKSYSLGEIQSASKSLKFVYATQRLSSNSLCSQTPKIDYLFRVPTDMQGNWYQLIRGAYEPCEYFNWVVPSIDANTIPDGVKISTGEKSTGLTFYSSSIDEILFPETWENARRFFQEKFGREAISSRNSRDSSSFTEIKNLKDAISSLQKENVRLKSSLANVQSKLQKVCQTKPRPKSC